MAIYEAEEKYGRLTPDLQRALCLIAEEFGELAKNIVDYTRANAEHLRPRRCLIITEAAQLAGLCIALIENIVQGRTK